MTSAFRGVSIPSVLVSSPVSRAPFRFLSSLIHQTFKNVPVPPETKEGEMVSDGRTTNVFVLVATDAKDGSNMVGGTDPLG